jgi:hypothetical protein
MFLGLDVGSFFDNIFTSYNTLPNESKLIVYIIVILVFIVMLLAIITIEHTRWNMRKANKAVNKTSGVSENTEVLDFDIDEIDETNEKTRNLKEITDKIQAVIDNKNIDLTKFEQDQEENSIISYDELMKKVGKAPEETPKQDFSLPDLVHKIEVDEEIEKETPFVNPTKEEKFKSSVFISPVFGIQDQSRTIIKEEPPKPKENVYVQENYAEEETFLTNLRNFRKKLE